MPNKFHGLATLPMYAAKEATKELERSVINHGFKGVMCGRNRDKNLDHRDFWELFECAEMLGVPLFIHPQAPQKSVRDIYYLGFNELTDLAFATYGSVGIMKPEYSLYG